MSLVPSLKLDQMIEDRIMGRNDHGWKGGRYVHAYSRDTGDAFDVVNIMRERGYGFALGYDSYSSKWTASFNGYGREKEVRGMTAAHCICLAALAVSQRE